MVVVPEPAVKCLRALHARAVDGALGPAPEQRADEALGFAVGLRTIGTGTAVADPELAASERVQGRDVGGAVVGQEPLGADPMAPVEGDRSCEEVDRGLRPLVRKHLRVGESAVVVGVPPVSWTAERWAIRPGRKAVWPCQGSRSTEGRTRRSFGVKRWRFTLVLIGRSERSPGI